MDTDRAGTGGFFQLREKVPSGLNLLTDPAAFFRRHETRRESFQSRDAP